MSVRVEKQGAITTVVLSRPQARNAVDPATAKALADAFRAFDADSEASVAVLFGEGGTFCAGADLKAFAEGAYDRVPAEGDGPMGPSRLLLDKPVVAAIEGYAVAGGLELALWCDLRVAAEDATFGVFCRRWGVPLIDGGTVRLPRLIGLSRALDLILTGRAVNAQEALQMGLANRVVPAVDLPKVTAEWAERLAAAPTKTVTMTKWLLNRSFESSRHTAFEEEGYAQEMVQATADAAEGMKAFVEKRSPDFRGW